MRLARHTRHSAVVGVAVAGMLLASAPPTTAATFGTANTAEAIAEVETALTAAEATAAEASVRAMTAEAAAQRARAAADDAAALSAELSARGAEAETALELHTTAVGTVAIRLHRATSEAPLLVQVLTSAQPESLLSRLSAMERVATASARLAGSARTAADTTAAQLTQAQAARAEHERLTAAADEAAASARDEAAAEAGAVAGARGELDELYSRLAALRRTSVPQAKTERIDRQVAEQAASQPGAGVIPSPGQPGAAAPSSPPIVAPPIPAPPITAPPVSAPPPVVPPATGIATPAQAQAHARTAVAARGWGDDQFSCLVHLWNRESGWRVEARNPSSGAYGIPQAYPAEKLAAAGPDWRTSAATQISWGLSYISARYSTPCGAWDHSERTGWY